MGEHIKTVHKNLKRTVFGILVSVSMFSATPVIAQSFWEETHLTDVRVGSSLSSLIRELRRGGYQLSDGADIEFSKWYSSAWRDLQFSMMTQMTKNFGILWGFGTGERGQKYAIDPSLKIGFIWQSNLSENTTISLMATTILAGKLSEKPCVADYGEIGGIQTVNCRLAATFLPPAETLKYLLKESPADQVAVRFQLVFRF